MDRYEYVDKQPPINKEADVKDQYMPREEYE
jgi:hypothetical protein